MIGEALLASLIATTGVHIDMGELYGSHIVNDCLNNWPMPPHIEQDQLDKKLGGMFKTLHKADTSTLYISFAQLADAADLASGIGGSATNTVAELFAPGIFMSAYKVGDTQDDFLTYFNTFAKKRNKKLSISFGGPEASPSDMLLSQNTASDLKTFMKKYHFVSIDLSLEGSSLAGLLQHNKMPDILNFIKNMNKPSLTIGKNLADGPKGALAPIFNRFGSRFSKLILKLFDEEGKYYIKPSNPDWGVQAWSRYVQPAFIGIGFSDKINYNDPNACGDGKPFKLPAGLTNGQAAALIFKKTQQLLGKKLGEPVFWVENPSKLDQNQFVIDFRNQLKK